MKMAKPKPADMAAAAALASLMNETFSNRCIGGCDPTEYSYLQRLYERLEEINMKGSISRVIWGMHTVMQPENEVVDPDSNTLQLHPKILTALAERKGGDDE